MMTLRSPVLLLAAMMTLASAVAMNTARAGVKVSFQTLEEKFKDTIRKRPVMVVDNGGMKVDFARDTFWTVRDIFYKGVMVGQASGGTGAVVHWDGKPVGTVHRDGDKQEKLLSVDLIIDGKTIPLWADGREVVTAETVYEGKDFGMVKRSLIGPFQHEAHFTWKDGTNALTATNSFEAVEDVTAERFKGYRYVFMHMMPLVMTEWMRVNPDGTVASGTVKDEKPDKARTVWLEPGRGMAVYAPESQTGIAYFYPAGTVGKCEYSFRGGKDTKFRAVLFDQDQYAKGDKRAWTLTLEPFTSAPDAWMQVAAQFINAK